MLKHTLLVSLCALLSAGVSHAAGRTADGCTYRVVNGQYLTDCSGNAKKNVKPIVDETPEQAAERIQREAVTNYGDVPVRSNPYAPPASEAPATADGEADSSAQEEEPAAAPVRARARTRPPREQVAAPTPALAPTPSPARPRPAETFEEERENREHKERVDRIVDDPYVALNLGPSVITAVSGGSAFGAGATFGSLLDDFFGVELSYNYARQDINLGLPLQEDSTGNPIYPPGGNDANIQTHLLAVETQGYLTNALSAFRPYLGLGLAWKSSSLRELNQPQYYAPNNYDVQLTVLRQSSLGAIGSAGAKLRVSTNLAVTLAFRYYLPLLRQGAELDQQGTAFGVPGGGTDPARITPVFSSLTGSSQYQLSGGLQYSF